MDAIPEKNIVIVNEDGSMEHEDGTPIPLVTEEEIKERMEEMDRPKPELWRDLQAEQYETMGKEMVESAMRIREELARRRAAQKAAGRNDPCPCGSGKKFKKCCCP